MSDAIGSKNTCQTFSTEFSTGGSSRKVKFFDWIRQSEFSVEKRLFRLNLFRLLKKARFQVQSKKAVFD